MEMTRTQSRGRLIWGLAINYLIHGMGLVIISQNMSNLKQTWHQPIAMIAVVISAMGIGRLLGYAVVGVIAERVSRKTLVFVGMSCYLIFVLGLISLTDLMLAYAFTLLAGIANAALDAGTYPTLAQVAPQGSAVLVSLKAFMAVGEFILPLVVVTLAHHQLWYGFSFVLLAGLIIANMLWLAPQAFPQPVAATPTHPSQMMLSTTRRLILLVALGGFGYTSMAAMLWFTQWISVYAQQGLHLASADAHWLLSLYSLGSFSGVLVAFGRLQHAGCERRWLVQMTSLATIALSWLLLAQGQLLMLQVAALIYGFAAAGGVMQVGLGMLMQVVGRNPGRVTGAYYFLGSVASFTVPLLANYFSLNNVMLGNLVICGLNTGLAFVIAGVGNLANNTSR